MGFYVTFSDKKYDYEQGRIEVMELIINRLNERYAHSGRLPECLRLDRWEHWLAIRHAFLNSLSPPDWQLVLQVCEELLPEARACWTRQAQEFWEDRPKPLSEEQFQRALDRSDEWLKEVTEIARELATEGSEQTGEEGESKPRGA